MNSVQLRHLNGVDVVKFIMAFAVIIIHIQVYFSCTYSAFINWFIRLAVPFYFIVSGFLTARRINTFNTPAETSKYLKKRALRFGKMFLLWLLIYLPVSLKLFNYGNSALLLRDIELYVLKVFVSGESFLAWPLWYLYSSMIAYFLLSVITRCRFRKYFATILALIILGGCALMKYLILPEFTMFIVKGIFERVLGGFPYIVTGFLIFKYSRELINLATVLIFTALSCLLFYFDFTVFPLFGGAALFALSYMMSLQNKGIYKDLNVVGIWMYLTHMFNLIVGKAILDHTHINFDKYALMLFIFAFTFVTSTLLYRLSKTKHFTWLQKLV